ncbi:DNA adenine methylase [Alteraurantiacibacter palmitatis]|uniref:site-specific DNA-methyltransferase (adenine-specific) n=1 Tax=Alteraurantiacibacter palmitatis TaxID=2054628 RepID=A0ABV7E7I3_9SPHN
MHVTPTSSILDAIRPVTPAAGYQGGKRNLSRRICGLIDRLDHDGYAEPFVGMGGIFLRRSTRPRAEIINDISGDVATFFRVLQEHYPYFVDMLRWRVSSRSEFERLRALPPEQLTDLQRAARFLYLQRLAFGGKIQGRNFGVDARSGGRFNLARLEPMLSDIHERLQGVVIEQLPFERFIARYDRPGMLFYCDPPYFGCEGDYGADIFAPEDFARLAGIVAGARGRFIVSLNDTPEVRAIFAGLHLVPVETTWTIGSAHAAPKKVGEVLIANFDLAAPG